MALFFGRQKWDYFVFFVGSLTIVKKALNQSREIVENDKNFNDQSNGTENDKNDFQLGEFLTSSSEATGNPKETWGDENYKPPWGWDPIPFPEDPSWAENNEINERLARVKDIKRESKEYALETVALEARQSTKQRDKERPRSCRPLIEKGSLFQRAF